MFEEIMTENFSKLMTHTKSDSKAQSTPSKIHTKVHTHTHTHTHKHTLTLTEAYRIQMAEIKTQNEHLECRERRQITYRGTRMRITVHLSSETMPARRHRSGIFKVLRQNC